MVTAFLATLVKLMKTLCYAENGMEKVAKMIQYIYTTNCQALLATKFLFDRGQTSLDGQKLNWYVKSDVATAHMRL